MECLLASWPSILLLVYVLLVLRCVAFCLGKETLQCRVATDIIVDASIPDSDLLAGWWMRFEILRQHSSIVLYVLTGHVYCRTVAVRTLGSGPGLPCQLL